MEYIVIAIMLIEFRSLASRMFAMSVKNNATGRDSFSGIGIEFTNGDYALESSAAASISMHHIYTAIIIPQWSRVNDTLASLNQYRFSPRASNVLCLGHKSSLIGISPKDIEPSIMMANGGCPYTHTMKRSNIIYRRQCIRNGSTYDLPVYQVLRMKYLQTRNTVKA